MATRFIESGAVTLDTDDLNAVTNRLTLPEGATNTTMFVVAKTGSHSTHQVTLQISPNGTNWFDISESPVTGAGVIEDHKCSCPVVRAKVKVAEGSTSTCDIYIISS